MVKEKRGCDSCAKTGYKGRIGVFEMMENTPEIQELITQKSSTQKIRDIAYEQGMNSLKKESIRLIHEGITTVDEVKHVIG